MPDRSPTLLDFGPHKELIKRELPMLRIEKESNGHTTTLRLTGRIQSAKSATYGLKAASSEWCVIREGDTYFARVERSFPSFSLSAFLGQPTSKGESIGSRSVLDSTLVPVVRFRHLASVRHHVFDDNAVSFQYFSNWQRTCISICEKLTWGDQ